MQRLASLSLSYLECGKQVFLPVGFDFSGEESMNFSRCPIKGTANDMFFKSFV